MGRSGTSLLAGSLRALGVNLGSALLPPAPDNPKGFFEDERLKNLNDRLLALQGLSWTSTRLPRSEAEQPGLRALEDEAVAYVLETFPEGSTWGFKDPRTSRVLPFWQRVFGRTLSDDRYVLMVRHPVAVATSLATRQSMTAELAYMLWFEYNLLALRALNGRIAVVVDYDRLLDEPAAQLRRIADGLDLPAPAPEDLDELATDFLEQGLRHTIANPSDLTWAEGVPDLFALLELCRTLSQDTMAFSDPSVQATARVLEDALRSASRFVNLVDSAVEALRDQFGAEIARLEKYTASQSEGVRFWEAQARRWEGEMSWWRKQAESWERAATGSQ